MAIDKATTTSDFGGFLKPEIAQVYFDEARKASVVQSLARQVPLGVSGAAIPVTTTKPTAGWVAEGGKKPTTKLEQTIKTMEPKKLAAIAVVSAEVVRANPGGYIETLVSEIAEAFANAFDAAALHGTGSPFDSSVSATDKTVTIGTAGTGLHSDINAGLDLLVQDGKRLTGFAFDSVAEPLFNGALDTANRPIFNDGILEDASAPLRSGRLLGRPAYIGDGVGSESVVGFGGDWSKALWGVTGGISYDISTQAPVTIGDELVSLWEHNLVAIRAEAEYGFILADDQAFVKYAPAVGE